MQDNLTGQQELSPRSIWGLLEEVKQEPHLSWFSFATVEEREKPAVGKALLLFQKPYGEGNMQRLFQNAYPFLNALHLH